MNPDGTETSSEYGGFLAEPVDTDGHGNVTGARAESGPVTTGAAVAPAGYERLRAVDIYIQLVREMPVEGRPTTITEALTEIDEVASWLKAGETQ